MTAPKKKNQSANVFDTPADRSFCRTTHSFNPDSQSRLSNLGAYLLWRIDRGRGLGWFFWSMKVTLVLSLGLLVAALWWPDELNRWQELVSICGLLVFAVPSLWRSAWLSSSKHKIKFFISSDFWISVFAISFLAEDFPQGMIWKPLFSFSFCSLWIWFRLFEAKSWRTSLQNNFQKEERLWHHSVGHSSLRGVLILAVLATYGIVVFVRGDIPISSLSLGMAVACWPFHIAILNKLFQKSESHFWRCLDWNFFRSARSMRILLSHFQGVFTQPQLKVRNVWLESIHEWPDKSIEEVLYKVALTSDHPICKAIVDHLPSPKNDLIQVKESGLQEHLGIQGSVRDVQGGLFQFVLGSLGWHRILQTSMSNEGRQFLKQAIDNNLIVVLLSLNENIVAAIALESKLKPDAEEGAAILSAQFKWGLLSSASMKWAPTQCPSTLDFDLFPVEREMLRKQAEERFHQYQHQHDPVAAEVLAPWDLKGDPSRSNQSWKRILVAPLESRPSDLTDAALQIYSDRVVDIAAPFSASEWFKVSRRMSIILAFVLISILIFVPKVEFAALLLVLAAFIGTWWILRTEIE
jgi:hypothetical protein